MLESIKKLFDKWAKAGRAELMEKEHLKTVQKFLESVDFERSFSFLDVGCGNGWVVRKIAQLDNCKKAVGIDKSKNMILRAKSKKRSSKEAYFQADILNWRYNGRFDYIFSMESLYYSIPMESALRKIFRLLKGGGVFFCGTDFYKDNKATLRWPDNMKVQMDLRSRAEWKKMFEDAGFHTTTKQVKDPKNRKKWKREFGTLFVIGTKC